MNNYKTSSPTVLPHLNISLTASTHLDSSLNRSSIKRNVFFDPKSHKKSKSFHSKPNITSLMKIGSSDLNKNLSLYEKNYNNLMDKSFLERIYRAPMHVIHNKAKILLAAKYEEPKIILSFLYENLASALQAENLNFLCDTISLIGECNLIATDFGNALHAFKELKMVADLMLDENRKLQALIKLSDCCKMLKKYDHSLKFLRKALQYCWHLNADEIELQIYDKLGLIYYLIGDIVKAKYYHDRFIQNKLESEKSPCRYGSEQILAKIFELNHGENYNIYSASATQIIPMILSKLSITMKDGEDGIVFSKKEEGIFDETKKGQLFYDKKRGSNKKRVEFTTELTPDMQLENIFEEKEFQFEIASPRYPRSIKIDHEILEDKPSENESPKNSSDQARENIYISSQILKNHQLFPLNNKKPEIKHITNFMQKKISLDDKIAIRNKETYSNHELWKRIKMIARDNNSMETRKKNVSCYYNHLTPNRNFIGFQYFYKIGPLNKMVKKYYNNIIFG